MELQLPSSTGWITDNGDNIKPDTRPVIGWVVNPDYDLEHSSDYMTSPFFPVILNEFCFPMVIKSQPVNMNYEPAVWRKLVQVRSDIRVRLLEES